MLINKSVLLTEIITYLNTDLLEVHADPTAIEITNLCSPQSNKTHALDWVNISAPDPQSVADSSAAQAIIAPRGVKYSPTMQTQGKVLLIVDNPRTIIARIGNKFFVEKPIPGIHPTAVVHPDASIAASASIGAFCSVGKCTIGANSILESRITIHDAVEIGDNVFIHSGAVIGTEGLGCFRDQEGMLTKFPHLGGLQIGNEVEIGANCSIAKGSLSNTIIGKGTKINSLCFIAHNCIIGENVLITGNSMLNGSVKVGANATIYSNVIIGDQRSIGAGAVIGMGAVVTKNVPPLEVWVGNPAGFLKKVNNEGHK